MNDRLEPAADRDPPVRPGSPEAARRLDSLGQLAGGVAHDVNNLLGVILNLSALLGRRLADPSALRDLHEIQLAAEEAVGLTRQLLAVAGRAPADPELLVVNDVVRNVAAKVEAGLDGRVELRVEMDAEAMVCLVDERQISWIVTALAQNADDAMPAGGRLTIRVRRSTEASHFDQGDGAPAPDVVVEVVDTGSGMTPELVSRAFEPFFTTKPRTSGTGLGLAMVYGLVGQNAGDVSVRSTPGVGTTVTVTLPGHEHGEDPGQTVRR